MCWKCGKIVEAKTPVTRSSICEFCGQYLHSCRNCEFYEPGAHYDCHETVDEAVTDKEGANFCGWFSLLTIPCARTGDTGKSAAAKKAFNSLFAD
jgi:hypothetical protein